jgi:hypothetical protein
MDFLAGLDQDRVDGLTEIPTETASAVTTTAIKTERFTSVLGSKRVIGGPSDRSQRGSTARRRGCASP